MVKERRGRVERGRGLGAGKVWIYGRVRRKELGKGEVTERPYVRP